MSTMTAIPKTTPPRLRGNAMRKFRFEIFMRDQQRCLKCGCRVSFNGKDPKMRPMHLAHRRNKRMWGDSFENCFTACSRCHLVDLHMGGKVVPAKGVRV